MQNVAFDGTTRDAPARRRHALPRPVVRRRAARRRRRSPPSSRRAGRSPCMPSTAPAPLARHLGAAPGSFVLVRPDAYVAAQLDVGGAGCHRGGAAACALARGSRMKTEPNIPDPDGFYEAWVAAHDGLSRRRERRPRRPPGAAAGQPGRRPEGAARLHRRGEARGGQHASAIDQARQTPGKLAPDQRQPRQRRQQQVAQAAQRRPYRRQARQPVGQRHAPAAATGRRSAP